MKIFACKNQGSYCGGLILVAARTKEEAFSIASTYEGIEKVIKDFYNPKAITSDTYPIDEWFEVKHLSTDLTEPQVIIEDHYSE